MIRGRTRYEVRGCLYVTSSALQWFDHTYGAIYMYMIGEEQFTECTTRGGHISIYQYGDTSPSSSSSSSSSMSIDSSPLSSS